MKIAFALIPEKGHINPYIGPAQALVDMGHQVVVGAPGDISDQIARAGLVFRPDLVAASADDRVTRGPVLVELIQDPQRLSRWIEQLLLGGIADQVPRIRDWLQRERADVAVVDPLYYPAAIAAHQCGLPWASVSNSLNPVVPNDLHSALLGTLRRISLKRSQLFRDHGLDPAFSFADVLSPYRCICDCGAGWRVAPRRDTGRALVSAAGPRRRGGNAPVACESASGLRVIWQSALTLAPTIREAARCRSPDRCASGVLHGRSGRRVEMGHSDSGLRRIQLCPATCSSAAGIRVR